MEPQPKVVLHVLNSAGGGAALSTMGLMSELRRSFGIQSCAVCHDAGTNEEREALLAATEGATWFTTLYWWNRKIRAPLWKRPLIEIKQRLRTDKGRKSAAFVESCAIRFEADLIHTNTILTPEGGLAAASLGLPHVWHLREMVGPGQPFRLPYEGSSFGRYMRTHCSKLIANSNASAAIIRDWLPPNLLEIVPNGIDISHFTPRTLWDHPGPLVVGMVGNLTSRWKKHRLFIEAAAKIDRQMPVEFRFYGHDPSHGGTVTTDAYLNELHALIRAAGLQDRFRFAGHVADPAQIMSEIDILVHPADSESFGRIVVEAMAAGLPVVGVRAGGVGEIVLHEETGLLAEPDNTTGLASHIDRLVGDAKLRRAFGTAGRQRAEAYYSLTACAAGVFRVYQQALAKPLAK